MFLCADWPPLCVFVISDLLVVTALVPFIEHSMHQLEICCLQLVDGYVLILLFIFAK